MQVLILGGQGRIGAAVAADLAQYAPAAQVTCTGRKGRSAHILSLDLADAAAVHRAIATLVQPDPTQPKNLVIHCAGPFHQRNTVVLEACITYGVNYLDVSDHPSYLRKLQAWQGRAEAAGVTAIANTGVFPGLSNSMVRADVEQLDQADQIHLSYVVGGSGGAGVTILRTTFLGLLQPFMAWRQTPTDRQPIRQQPPSQWQLVQPYSDREVIQFPAPFGRTGVYWFDVPEAFTLPQTFPQVREVVTKFGSTPDLYNHLTWLMARMPRVLKLPGVIELLSQVSFGMTRLSDRFSGVGVAMRSQVTGQLQGVPTRVCSTFSHPNTAVAAGMGAGGVAQLLLSEQLQQPGVWPVEACLPTPLFEQMLAQRGVKCDRTICRIPAQEASSRSTGLSASQR